MHRLITSYGVVYKRRYEWLGQLFPCYDFEKNIERGRELLQVERDYANKRTMQLC